jgi:hypothetical protein
VCERGACEATRSTTSTKAFLGRKWNLSVAGAVVSHDVGDYSKCLVAREVYGVSSLPLSICASVASGQSDIVKKHCARTLKEIQRAVSI